MMNVGYARDTGDEELQNCIQHRPMQGKRNIGSVIILLSFCKRQN